MIETRTARWKKRIFRVAVWLLLDLEFSDLLLEELWYWPTGLSHLMREQEGRAPKAAGRGGLETAPPWSSTEMVDYDRRAYRAKDTTHP